MVVVACAASTHASKAVRPGSGGLQLVTSGGGATLVVPDSSLGGVSVVVCSTPAGCTDQGDQCSRPMPVLIRR
jgi:hypothetical protein